MVSQSENHFSPFVAPRKADEWNRSIHNSVKRMHQSLSVLYENVEEEPDLAKSTNDDTEIQDDEPVTAVAERFIGHCDSLNRLLRTASRWPVQLPMNSVLKVLARCLKVTPADLKSKPSLSDLADVLPSLHGSALLIMTQLIACCGSHVLPRSRMIIDACLNSLAGAKHAKGEAKSITRGKAFHALCLMVERFGWGRYLQSLSQTLVQDLISDICAQETPKTDSSVTAAKPKQEVESIAQRKSKKKKKGKKKKGDSYSNLPVYVTDDTGNGTETKLVNVEATQTALELSQLIIQRAEYSQVQTLMRSLLKTSKSLQREGPALSSPYSSDDCRKALYSAVSACATVRLGRGCDRKETIGHFQITNLAMSLLTAASHSDPSHGIQKSCNEFLVMIKNTGNLNRPIVRKILPDEEVITKDITEVEREAERLAEQNKSIWQQLVDAQLELEAKGRELEQLQHTLARTKAIDPKDRKDPAGNGQCSVEKSIDENSGASSEEEEREKSSQVEKDNFQEEREADMERRNDSASDTKITENTNSAISANSSSSMSSKADSPKPSVSSSAPVRAKDKKKRSLDDKDGEARHGKKAKSDEANKEFQTEDIEAMISDFIDTAPDQF